MPITEGGRFSPVDSIVSPGVFTRENDKSFLAQGVADIGGAVVAPFSRGPAFAPTVVRDVSTLESKFGLADGTYYGPYTAKQYLQEQGLVTICRVGGLTGYWQKNPYMIYAVSGSWTRADWNLVLTTGSALGSGQSYVLSRDGDTDPYNILTYVSSSTTQTLVLNGTLYGIFANYTGSNTPVGSGSAYANGAAWTIGTFTTPALVQNTTFWITSSIQGNQTATAQQKLAQALVECTTTTASISGSYTAAMIPITASSTFSGTTIYLRNLGFSVIRAATGCGAVLYVTSGSISGSFGDYTGTFVSGSLNTDPCAVGSDSSSVQLLAVLANTQFVTQTTSDLSLPGFSGSVLSQITGSTSTSASVNSFQYNLNLQDTINGSAFGTYQFSLNPNDTSYITSVFGRDATAGNQATYVSGQKVEAAYLYNIFEDSITKIVAEPWKWKILGGTTVATSLNGTPQARVGELLKFTDGASLTPNTADSEFSVTNAYTPWINSQGIANWQGSSASSTTKTRFPLFKVHTLGDGTVENKRFKVEISNVKLAGTVPGSDYGSFTLSIRKYDDTDKRPDYVEIYQNLNLDATSANYIARRIGDRYNYITFAGKIIEFGTYPNLSQNVRVEMTDIPYPISAVPYGFSAYATPVDSNYGKFVPQMSYGRAATYASQPGKYPSGVVFNDPPTGADSVLTALYPTASAGTSVWRDTEEYFAPLPAYGANISVGANVPFDLEDTTTLGGIAANALVSGGTATVAVPSYYDSVNESTYVKMRKFVLGFQAGFDGQWPGIPINVGSSIIAGNTQGLDCTGITSAGSIAYKQCLAALGNAEEWDINLITMPGIFSSLHSYVTNLAVEMCESRGDAFYIMDNVVFPSTNQTTGMIDAAIAEANKFDTNYAATYYPWVKILDTNTNQVVSVPPSVVLPAVYASNDRAAAEWFAPAGLNRGGITQAVQVLDRTTHSERDDLYENRVNPIAAFPGQGICVWGQKTLQVKPSALDRVNVRRLLIALKKYIASTSRYLVFEQNVASTRNSFLAIVNPYLENVQQRSGLYAFQVVMDDTNNTPDLIDRNILYGQIYLQPTKTAEFIVLDFNIMPTGASFANV